MSYMTQINTFNDFDKLNSIILGRADISNASTILNEDSGYVDDISLRLQYSDELKEDRENLKQLLISHNINVMDVPEYNLDCVEPMNENFKEQTGNKKLKPGYRCTSFLSSPRDSVFTYDNTIIECSVDMNRTFYYTQHMKNIFDELAENTNNRYIQMPENTDTKILLNKPIIEFKFKNKEFFDNNIMNKIKYNTLSKIQIDGANILRLGKDLFVNITTISNLLGYQWLKQQFPDVNFHPMSICRKHIDGTITALRPGLLLMHTGWQKDYKTALPKELQNWDIVFFDSDDIDYTDLYAIDRFNWGTTDINILSIDRNTIIVQQECYKQYTKLLKNYNFEIIPVQLRNTDLWNGALHCITSDVNRDGVMESYF